MGAPNQPLLPSTPSPQGAQGVRSQESEAKPGNGNGNGNGNGRVGGIALTQLTDPRARAIAAAARYLPRTPEGQVAAFIRADYLTPDIQLDQRVLQSTAAGGAYGIPEIATAFMPLGFDDGFPAQPDGRPVWFQMEHEPLELFAAFEIYVNAVDSGPRYIADLLSNGELQRLLGDRLTLDTLRNAYYMYFWKDRATSHDIFQEAAYRHIRTRRALSSEDKAYALATKMLDKLTTSFDKPDFWEALEASPKTMLDYLEKLIKIQRISAGLPGGAPTEENAQVTSFEMIMRRVAGEAQANNAAYGAGAGGGEGSTLDEKGRLIPGDNQFLKGALNNPNVAQAMQELVIRVTQANGATKQPRWVGRDRVPGAGSDPSQGEGEGEGEGGEELDANEIPSEFRNLAG